MEFETEIQIDVRKQLEGSDDGIVRKDHVDKFL
jgi:hypothetical protein